MMEIKSIAVAVVGMCGSGKSVFADHFIADGWPCVYFGGLTMKILAEKNLPKHQVHEKAIREELRKTYGMEAYAKLLYPEIENLLKTNNVVLDGLYSWAEYKYLKEHLGDQLVVVAVITERNKRYERLESRPVRALTQADAIERDYHEIEKLDKGGPIAIADYYLQNNASLSDLEKSYQDFIAWLKARKVIA